MKVSELARKAGVGVETIRFYERKKLIEQPLKPSRGYRIYSENLLPRISFIRGAQQIGFSLNEISELMELASLKDTQCDEVRRRAERKLSEVDIKLENLSKIKAVLHGLIDACPGRGSIDKCSILNSLNSQKLDLDQKDKGDRNDT